MQRTYDDLLALWETAELYTSADAAHSLENVGNSREIESGNEDKTKIVPAFLSDVIQDIMERTDKWPRRVDSKLFVHDPNLGICWLGGVSSLFGWMQQRCGIVDWVKGPGFCTKEELYAELCRTGQAYKAIEYLPHWPAIPNHYYACNTPTPGCGDALNELLNRFSPGDRDRSASDPGHVRHTVLGRRRGPAADFHRHQRGRPRGGEVDAGRHGL